MTVVGHDPQRQPPDLRLVAPALAAWAGAAGTGLAVPPVAVLWIAGMLLCVTPLCVVTLLRRRTVRRPVGAVLACLACLAAGVLAAGLPARARALGPLAALGAARAAADIEGTVTGDPRVSHGGNGELVIVPVRVERLAADGHDIRLRQPVLVLATASGWEDLLPSQHVSTSGKLAPPRAGDTVAAVVFVRAAPASVGPPSSVQRAAGQLRAGLRDATSGLVGPRRGLLPGLVLGDTSNLDDEVREDFRTAGMSHLVAVSGANCAIIIAAATVVVRRSRLAPWVQAGWVAMALVGFVILARPSPSVMRAGVMGLIGIVAAGSGRSRLAMPALAATVLVLVLSSPDLARSVGFTLSVAATAGLVILVPGWRDALAGRLPRWLAEPLAVAAAAHVACSPVLVAIGGGVSLVAVPANMLAEAAVAPATILGVLATVAAVVHDPLARFLATFAGVPCGWLITVADVAARVPGAEIGWPAGPAGAVALVAATVVLLATVRRRRGRRVLITLSVITLGVQVILMSRIVGILPTR
ncbi:MULTISPECIES: ComEC/Rec2 family competence protein [Protofrankia]|uniref:ComEC/Rec2-related protein n=1 Tax=Candidatus Protofrankia datiscae TaxID=2716812 RepID=F8B3W6_9ACTN|nr:MULTISPECIES: ComEC/Rec2 family competence protein [Protofrankia]AEH09066.1 ComEC/Rec2-related protein [Candidatus Protofrankia datiscae]